MDTPPHPFSFRDYRFFWGARLMTTLAQMSMVIVIGWQVYDIARQTMDPQAASLQLGWVGLVQFAPMLLLSLVVGWVADRADRRWIARGALLFDLLCAVTLAWLAWTGTTTLPALFGVAGVLGVARAFAGPALSGIAPNLVPKASLPTAIALSSIAWQGATIFGPPLGGFLYGYNHWLPYTVSAALFGVALALLLLVRPFPRAALAPASPWQQMVEGLRYVRKNRLVLGAISLDLFAVLLGGATAMLPVYARDVLHVGAEGLGQLRAAPAFGASMTALWFAFRPLKTNVGSRMLWAVGVFGLATVGFGMSTTMPLSLACLAVLGAADMFSVYVRQSLVQLYTPDEMRGRVGAVASLFVSASNELGEAESGFLAATLGPVPSVIAGGVGAVMVTAVWTRWFPELREARSFAPTEEPKG